MWQFTEVYVYVVKLIIQNQDSFVSYSKMYAAQPLTSVQLRKDKKFDLI